MTKEKKIISKLKKLNNNTKIEKAKELCTKILFKESGIETSVYVELLEQELNFKTSVKEINKWREAFVDDKLKRIKDGCMTVYFDDRNTIKEVMERIEQQECPSADEMKLITRKLLMRWGKEWSKKHPSATDKEWVKGK